MNTKYISSSELKTSEFSRVRSTSENFYVFNSRDDIYLAFTEKKQIRSPSERFRDYHMTIFIWVRYENCHVVIFLSYILIHDHFFPFFVLFIYFILFYFISFHFISFHFILFYFILFYFILFYFILFFILFYFILFYFILFYFISFHFISFHFISFYFILFYFILFYFDIPPKRAVEPHNISANRKFVST